MMLLDISYFVAACIVLSVSSVFLVKNLKTISIFLRVSEFAAAFIIMAAATSLPELFVGISSALTGNPELSFGNVLGANLLDMTLVLGIIVVAARGIKIEEKGLRKDTWLMSAIVLLPLVLFIIGNRLSRIDGIILIAVFLLYSVRMLKTKRKRYQEKIEGTSIRRRDIVIAVLVFSLCLYLLFLSSEYIVKYAPAIAEQLKLPPIMVGLFLVSIGTTLPELSFGVSAAMLRHGEMSLGDQVGTVIFNSTLILGVVAIIHPISATFSPFIIASAFLLFVSFLFITFAESGNKLAVKEGISLLLMYILFVMVSFYLKPAN